MLNRRGKKKTGKVATDVTKVVQAATPTLPSEDDNVTSSTTTSIVPSARVFRQSKKSMGTIVKDIPSAPPGLEDYVVDLNDMSNDRNYTFIKTAEDIQKIFTSFQPYTNVIEFIILINQTSNPTSIPATIPRLGFIIDVSLFHITSLFTFKRLIHSELLKGLCDRALQKKTHNQHFTIPYYKQNIGFIFVIYYKKRVKLYTRIG